MITVTPPPPGMMRMASGRIVPISRPFGASTKKVKRFLIALSFYEGDRAVAEQLLALIADLERTRNRDNTDLLLVRRADCRELSPALVAKLGAKFDKVMTHACRRHDAKSYPMGPNQMFCDLVQLIGTKYANDYFAFLNLETDAVPTRPGWIGELVAGWEFSQQRGKSAIGHIHDNPRTHLNGLAVYSTDIIRRVGGNRLMGCSPQICYDIAFAGMILPHADDTPLIYFKYRQPTITATELFAPQKNGVAPALYHGVKDGSARAAVKARHITFTERPEAEVIVHRSNDLLQVTEIQAPTSFGFEQQASPQPEPGKRPNVYTYVSNRGRPSAESLAIVEAWRKGWTTRGWNPVVLTIRDAALHSKFDEFSAAIDKLPYVGDRKRQQDQFYRWLALDVKGGGMLVDTHVLPRNSTHISHGEPVVLRSDDGSFLGIWIAHGGVKDWITQIMQYDAQPSDLLGDKPHVSDGAIVGHVEVDMKVRLISPSPVIGFSSKGMGTRTSVAMEKFLAGAEG